MVVWLVEAEVPMVKWKVRADAFSPASEPEMESVRLAPGGSVPNRKEEPESAGSEEESEKPKGSGAATTTFARGTGAFERAVSRMVNGLPETVSAGASTETESGVVDTASA
ncbi:hypothetical protein HY091_03215 [Candidatus Kaiserbacteria bacterium]|nr:hypothetical protein [Candidatus Kaiserbacteria bacterium]